MTAAGQQQETARRILPQSELDFNLMTTDSVWGSPYINQTLKDQLNRFVEVDEQGRPIVPNDSLWGLLGFYSRDMRLANLSQWNGEIQYCQYYLDLAGDLLQVGMVQPFLIALSRTATILELSQSKEGFLRKRLSTFTRENFNQELEPPKKSLFGGKKKE